MKLLVSNVGSTSLKFKLFDMPEERVLCEAKIERVGSRDAAIMSYRSHLSGARFSAEGLCIPSYAEGIALFLEKLTGDETGVIKGVEEISAIGFKTVLSRGYYGVHELTDEVMENMREYLYIAPVHNAAYIEAIGQFKAVLPDVPMIGVFETAFHREIPLERALYSIPYEWYEKYGIRKMGYHGASHGYIAQQAAKLGRAERVISCHLGGSCSICAILDGKSVECRRGLMCGMGYTEEEQKRPLIAVVNSWNEYNPGHVHLDKLAERVKQGVREAGGLPLEVMTTGICDGMVLKDPRYIEVPSRNSIADQVELTVDGNFFDGMVLLSSCDSVVPGHLMGAARLNIPAIMVTGGYMPLGTFRGKEVLHIHAQDKVGTAKAGKMDMDEYNGLIENSWGICGACTSMTTANSMCMIAEALGMTLPGNSTMCATSSSIYNLSYMAGKQIMNLVNEGITARQIITENAIKNAIMLDMAVAASSNLILHIPAIANEAGYDLPWWKYFDEASNEIPLLSHLAPSGPYNVKDFDLAGGMRAMLKELLPKLHGDCLTVTGHTLEENVRDAVVYNRDVIHSLDNPVMTEPGIGVLYGNLAPEGAIVKIAGVPSQLMTYKGKARVFDSLEDGIQALRAGQIHAGDCCVLRFMGLRGRFGTTAFTFQEELKGLHELYNSCAIITDGRFSGGTSGLSIGYVSPEAALGSPLGVIEEGDEVEIDIPARKLHLCISDEEMNRRLAAFHWEFPSKDYPRYLNLFVQNVGSMAKGGIWETK